MMVDARPDGNGELMEPREPMSEESGSQDALPDLSPPETSMPDATPPEDVASESLEPWAPPRDEPAPVEIGWKGIGSTLGRALDTYGSAFPTFLALALPVAIFSAVTVLAGSNVPAVIIASLLTALVGLVTSAAMIYTADDLWSGVRPSVAGALDRAAGRVVPLFLATLVVGVVVGGTIAVAAMVAIALAIGSRSSGGAIAAVLLVFTLAVVVATYFSLRWALSSPAIVLGDLGPLAGLNRSWSVTRRHLWRLAGLYVVLGLFVIPASGGASLLSTYASQRVLAAGALGLATLLTAPLFAIAFAIVYRDLAGRPTTTDVVVPRGSGRRTALLATLGGGLLVFVAGVWAISSSGGQIFLPERGQILFGTQQNVLDPCHPNGVKSDFDSSEEIWIGGVFTKRVLPGDDFVVEIFSYGTSLYSETLTAESLGAECYYEAAPLRDAQPATYRLTVTYESTIIADGTFTVR